jgi:fructose-specific phosphotransferase system component IIB
VGRQQRTIIAGGIVMVSAPPIGFAHTAMAARTGLSSM